MAIKVSTILGNTTNLVQDSSPVLGGNLQTAGYAILNAGSPIQIASNSYPAGTGTSGQVLTTDGHGLLSWETPAAGSITLIGDVTGSGASPVTTTIANTTVTPTTYGSTSNVGVFTVNSQGRITNASNSAITITPTSAGLGNVVNSLQIINAGNTPSIQTSSGVPSGSSTSGALYIDQNSTNGISIYRYTGSAWNPLAENLSLYTENTSSPTIPIVSASNAVAIGSGALASAVGSFAEGDGTNSRIYGQKSFANGKFSNAGDAQSGLYILRQQTSDVFGQSNIEMFLDGGAGVGTQRIILPSNSVFTFDILIAARRTDTIGGGAAYRFVGAAKKDSTNSSIVFIGIPSKTVLGETNSIWDVGISVDATNGALKLNVTGESGKIINWVATVQTAEVTN